jgi:allantoate deiminase
VLADMLTAAKQASERIAADEGCTVAWERIWAIEPIPFDPQLIDLADEVVTEVAGTSHRLPSGPLHDAAEMARLMPTVMLFVTDRWHGCGWVTAATSRRARLTTWSD